LTSEGSIKRALYLLYSQLLRCSGGEVELVHRTLYRYLTTTAEDLRAIPQAPIKEEHKGWVITHQPEFYMRPQTSHAELELLCVKYLNMACFSDPGESFQASEEGRNRWGHKVRQRIANHNFVRYAAVCWLKHREEAGSSSQTRKSKNMTSLLENMGKGHAISWSEVWWLEAEWPKRDYPTRPYQRRDIKSRVVSLYKQLELFADVAGLAIGDPAGQRFSSTEKQYTTITTIGHEC